MNTLDLIAQGMILVFCMTSIFLVNDPRPHVSRYGCVFGLISEPFWFYTCAYHHQWGLFAAAFIYTISWARGFYNQWIRKSP